MSGLLEKTEETSTAEETAWTAEETRERGSEGSAD